MFEKAQPVLGYIPPTRAGRSDDDEDDGCIFIGAAGESQLLKVLFYLLTIKSNYCALFAAMATSAVSQQQRPSSPLQSPPHPPSQL